VCLEALAEKGCSGQWTVDNLDSGSGLMASKIKVLRLRAMAMCLWVWYHTFVGSIMGGARRVPLIWELNYLKKFSRVSSGIKTIVPAGNCTVIILPQILFFLMVGC